MSEDLYAKLDLTKKVRFQKSENKDKNTEVCDDTDNSASKDTSTIYDNYCVEGSTPPKLDDSTTEDQQQIVSVSVNSHERNLVKAAAVFLVLLCLFLLAAVIVMWIQNTSLLCEMKTLNISLTTERDQLQISYNKMQNNFTTLSREQEQLQKNYSRIQNLNTNLTQRTEQLEEEKQNLGVFNSNLTQQRDQLKQQLETSRCIGNCTRFGNSCLFISNSTKTWNESNQVCNGLGGQLVIINTQEKQDFLSSTLGKSSWIGLTDQQNEGVWKWVDGTVVNRTFWPSPQPDNWLGNENCAQISKQYTAPNNWNDLSCNSQLNFVCEKIW
ncbi:C-type lectin domain family 10 member A-like [Channa argus]|uniref:C-type lectin domain family 10 member A-like n=1 Tax=Channa argus TaxID=215402 RepID=UPI0035216E14